MRRLFRDGGMRRWQDIKCERVRDQLRLYRETDSRAISVTTSNHYLQAAQQFCKWMVDDQKCALASPLAGMNRLDDTGKLVHERRALELEELHT